MTTLKVACATTIQISGIPGLDTVTVFLQDFEFGQGRLTVECYGKAWSSYWNAMEGPLAEFVARCNEHYLVQNLMRYRAHGMKAAEITREETYLGRIVPVVRDAIKSQATWLVAEAPK